MTEILLTVNVNPTQTHTHTHRSALCIKHYLALWEVSNKPCFFHFISFLTEVWLQYSVGMQEDSHEFLLTVLNNVYK